MAVAEKVCGHKPRRSEVTTGIAYQLQEDGRVLISFECPFCWPKCGASVMTCDICDGVYDPEEDDDCRTGGPADEIRQCGACSRKMDAYYGYGTVRRA